MGEADRPHSPENFIGACDLPEYHGDHQRVGQTHCILSFSMIPITWNQPWIAMYNQEFIGTIPDWNDHNRDAVEATA